jgi:hypothetical protein
MPKTVELSEKKKEKTKGNRKKQPCMPKTAGLSGMYVCLSGG